MSQKSTSPGEMYEVPLDEEPPSYLSHHRQVTNSSTVMTPEVDDSNKAHIELQQIPPLVYDEAEAESSMPRRPHSTASPIFGRKRKSRRRLYIVTAVVILTLLLALLGTAVGLAVDCRSSKAQDNVNISPVFNISGEEDGGTVLPIASAARASPTATTTVTTTSTAPTPISTAVITRTTFLSAAPSSAKRDMESPRSTSALEARQGKLLYSPARRDNIDISPVFIINGDSSTMTAESHNFNLILTITETTVTTPSSSTTTTTIIQPIVTATTLSTTTLPASKKPPITKTVVVPGR